MVNTFNDIQVGDNLYFVSNLGYDVNENGVAIERKHTITPKKVTGIADKGKKTAFFILGNYTAGRRFNLADKSFYTPDLQIYTSKEQVIEFLDSQIEISQDRIEKCKEIKDKLSKND